MIETFMLLGIAVITFLGIAVIVWLEKIDQTCEILRKRVEELEKQIKK